MTDTSNQPQMFASRPLAEMQAEQASAQASPSASVAAAAASPQQSARLPTLDIHFDDLPDEEFEEFNFPLRTQPGIIFTLGIDDDGVLFDIGEVTRDGTNLDVIEFFFESTFRRAVREDGTEVANGLKLLRQALHGNKDGVRESTRYLMSVVTTAADRWSEELTDTSMRPLNRAQRRARARRR